VESSGNATDGSCAFCHIISILKRPVIIILIAGLLIRFLLAPFFTFTYDIAHWAMVIQHLQAGFGLYDVPAYYYSPVWGYILSFLSLPGFFLFNLGTMGNFFETLLPGGEFWFLNTTPNVTTFGFNMFIKIPLIICDVIVGALVYFLIKERTSDEKKATLGFALWFLCPIAIYMSSVEAMFDNFSVLFMLLSVILIYKSRYFAGGAMLSLAIFTKFFPFYIAIPILAYIMLKHRDDKSARNKGILMGVLGLFIMTVVIHIPMIMEGTFIDSLWFALSRAESAGVSGDGGLDLISSIGFLAILLVQPLVIGLTIYFSLRLRRSNKEDADNTFFYVLLLTTAAVFIWIPAPQYLLIVVIFLAYHIAVSDRRYMLPWLLMGVGGILFALVMNNFSILTSLAAYTNLLDLDWVLGMSEWMLQPFMGTSVFFILFVTTGMIQAIGTWYILVIWFRDKMKLKKEAVI